jgi:hypothetical protein
VRAFGPCVIRTDDDEVKKGDYIDSRREEPVRFPNVMAGPRVKPADDPAIYTQKAGVWMPGSKAGHDNKCHEQ